MTGGNPGFSYIYASMYFLNGYNNGFMCVRKFLGRSNPGIIQKLTKWNKQRRAMKKLILLLTRHMKEHLFISPKILSTGYMICLASN